MLMVSTASADVVKIAQSQIGRGEIGGDNRGGVVREYTRGKECAWCAGFVSWVMTKDGKQFDYQLMARGFWNMKHKRVTNPRPGDIICFWRVSPTAPQGHVGIVESVNGDTITTIEGNTGSFPSVVKRKTYNLNKINNLLGFVRL